MKADGVPLDWLWVDMSMRKYDRQTDIERCAQCTIINERIP